MTLACTRERPAINHGATVRPLFRHFLFRPSVIRIFPSSMFAFPSPSSHGLKKVWRPHSHVIHYGRRPIVGRLRRLLRRKDGQSFRRGALTMPASVLSQSIFCQRSENKRIRCGWKVSSLFLCVGSLVKERWICAFSVARSHRVRWKCVSWYGVWIVGNVGDGLFWNCVVIIRNWVREKLLRTMRYYVRSVYE